MAKKAFEIQNSTLRVGGVELQAGTTQIVIPGVTQATNYFVEEVEDVDGANPDTFGSDAEAVQLLDNAAYLFRSGTETPSGSYSEAGYSVQELDDGEIEEIYVEVDGVFTSADKAFAEAGNMWATTVPNAKTNFNAGDWTQIAFRPKIRAGEVETIGGGGGGDLIVSGDNSLTIDDNGNAVFQGADGGEGIDRGLVWDYGASNDGTDSMVRQDNDGLSVRAWTTGNGGGPTGNSEDGSSAPVNIRTNQGENQKWWTFAGDGSLTFPDGTVQTTAYTGQTGSGIGNLSIGDNDESINSDNGLSFIDFNENGDDNLVLGTNSSNNAVKVSLNEGAHEFTFNSDGSLTFPDGTVQTTAYTGQTGGGSTSSTLYVAVNNDGRVFTSTDGLSWTEYTTSMTGVGRVAVGPDMIVYTASAVDASNGNDDALWYASTDAPGTVTEVTGFSDFTLNQVKYFANIEKFVAIGNNSINLPVILYSSNGVNWTQVDLDNGFLAAFDSGAGYQGNAQFYDIETNGTGFFLITSDNNLGAFYTTDITTSMGVSQWIDFSGIGNNVAFSKIAFVAAGSFTGWHIMQNEDDTDDAWYYNSNTNPTTGSFSVFALADVGSEFANEINYEPRMSEVVFGEYNSTTTIMIATGDGQILYWPAVENGPWVSIPKPYTATDFDITLSSTATITFGTKTAKTNEKIVLSNCTPSGYNGTYYVGINDFLYTTSDMGTAFDSSGLGSFESGTLTFSHGQFIDALHYSNGVFYAGNDDEEMFVSTDGGATWILTESFIGNPGEPEFMNDIDSYVTGGTISTGDITFNGVDIRGATNNNALGSINLVPNPALMVNGQYLEIYPTNANDAPHIHIAAGTGPTGMDGDLILGNDNHHVDINHSGEVRIRTFDSDTSTTYNWQFENDGGMIFPTLTVPISDNATPNGTGQTIKFSDPTQQAIIYGPASTVDLVNAERVIIQGAPGYTGTTGEGGDVYLWAGPGGDAGGDGGDIKIRAGRGQLTGSGGYLNFQAGQSGTGYGGYINIESGSSNTFGQGGPITIDAHSGAQITLRTYNSEGNSRDLILSNAGTLTLPGAVVKSTVEKVGADINANNVVFVVTAVDGLGAVTELTVTNSPNPAWVTGTSGLSLTDVDFTVSFDGAGNASVVVNSSGNGHSVSETFYLQPNAVGAVAPTPTALDLTKSINKLTNNINDNDYTLADGVEGQIMYLVPTPNTVDPTDIRVLVNHARNGGTQSLNAYLCPFGFNTFTGSICTLIFTDSHWQQVGGNWV